MAVSAYQTKQGRRYKANLYMHGKLAAAKRGFLTKKAARTWEQEEEKRRTVKTQGGTNFGFVANSYLDDMAARRRANTYGYKVTIINRLLAFMGGDFVFEQVTQEHIDNFLLLQLKERGAKSANRDCKELSILWNWAIRKNHIQTNPWRAVEAFPESKYERHVPTAEDIAAARLACTPEERQWIDALYFTGARLGEICRMEWKDVDLIRKTITLYTRKRRGGNLEGRTLAINDSLHALLSHRYKHRADDGLVFPAEDGGMHTHSNYFIRMLFLRVCKRAGIRRFTAHGIRHHVATRLKDSKQATSYQIQALLGHMNHRTTEIYLHELSVDRDVVNLLEERPAHQVKAG